MSAAGPSDPTTPESAGVVSLVEVRCAHRGRDGGRCHRLLLEVWAHPRTVAVMPTANRPVTLTQQATSKGVIQCDRQECRGWNVITWSAVEAGQEGIA